MSKQKFIPGQLSLFKPQTTWTPPQPSDWPDFTKASLISIDTETKDPELKTKGPGFARGKAHIVGVSLAAEGLGSIYLPIRHAGGGNVDEQRALEYLRHTLKTPVPKVGANIIYDLEALQAEGVEVGGSAYDVQTADSLLDETQNSYSLGAIAKRRLGESKDESMLQAGAEAFGVNAKDGMWQLPSGYVGQYAETDAFLPLAIFKVQQPLLEAEEMSQVFDLETRLIRAVLAMRFRGVRVDLDRADRLRKRLQAEEEALLTEMKKQAGIPFEVTQPRSMGRVYDQLGIPYFLTPKSGEPSFTAEYLKAQVDPFSAMFLKVKRLQKARRDFIDGLIFNFVTDKGRIHPTFRASRTEDGGARSGRFSGELPNLQQVPAKDDAYGPEIRSCIIPEDGCQWGALDYSQQEPRVTVHLAYKLKLRGSAIARQRYIDDPSTDYHAMVASLAGIERKPAKTLNLGAAYGMGISKMMVQLGMDPEKAKATYEAYHQAIPYVKEAGQICSNLAQERGWIKTLLGRRRRFNLWEPRDRNKGEAIIPTTLEQARLLWPDRPIRRAFTHKALNAAVQGGSADMVKKAMVDIHEAGLNTMHLTMHDELGVSLESDAVKDKIVQLMLDCVKLEVPLRVDAEVGPSWGEAK